VLGINFQFIRCCPTIIDFTKEFYEILVAVSAVVWCLALLPNSNMVLGSNPSWGLFCVEFACSSHANVGPLQVLWHHPNADIENGWMD